MADPIPNRLIQTAKRRLLPIKEQASAAAAQALNPGCEYCFFDDAGVQDFIASEFPQHLAIFRGFPYKIQQFDFFRYLVVYRLGGFYLDLDVMLVRNLEPLGPAGCVFPFEELSLNSFFRENCKLDWELGNYAFGAASGHPLLGAIIDNCVRAQRDPGWVSPLLRRVPRPFRQEYEVLYTTGPGLVTRTFAENPALSSSVRILFTDDVCDPANWHHFGEYGAHFMSGSWRLQQNLLLRFARRFWEGRALRRALAFGRAMGPRRSQVDLQAPENLERSVRVGA
jgi:hypothetical protein